MTLSTHVLDVSRGRPAAGLAVTLSRRRSQHWSVVGRGVTDADGRIQNLAEGALDAGVYRLQFATGVYFEASGTRPFYPEVTVEFTADDPGGRLHVPLLLSPYGYTTYKGS